MQELHANQRFAWNTPLPATLARNSADEHSQDFAAKLDKGLDDISPVPQSPRWVNHL